MSRERRSGFLVPTFGMSSTRGLDLAVPYYFNIAPNYDLTLTPRLMTKRGVMLDTEARFLYNNFETTVDYALMPDDKEMDDSRSSLHVDMSWRRDKLSAFVDYNRVSDDDFISDFSSNVRESSETVLPQEYALRYDETYWNTSINVKKNQALTFDHIDYYKPYERVPQITFNGYNGDFYGFEVGTTIEATRFEHPTFTTGDRFVFEQTVSYPMRGAGWFVVPKGTFLGTWYQLENLTATGAASPTRIRTARRRCSALTPASSSTATPSGSTARRTRRSSRASTTRTCRTAIRMTCPSSTRRSPT